MEVHDKWYTLIDEGRLFEIVKSSFTCSKYAREKVKILLMKQQVIERIKYIETIPFPPGGGSRGGLHDIKNKRKTKRKELQERKEKCFKTNNKKTS